MDTAPSRPWYRARGSGDLGRAFRTIRKSASETQAGLAESSAASRSTIQRLEQGEDVSQATVIALLAELGYEVVLVPRGATVRVDVE